MCSIAPSLNRIPLKSSASLPKPDLHLFSALLPKKLLRKGAVDQVYAELLDNLDDGILLVRPDGSISYVNQSAGRIVGVSAKKLLAQSITPFVASIHRQRLATLLRQAKRKPVAAELLVRPFRAHTDKWVALSLTKLQQVDEPIIAVTLTDLSFQKGKRSHQRLDDILARREESFHLVAEAIPQIVWTARPDGFMDYYNKRWTDYTGLTPERTFEEGWAPALHPEDTQRCHRRWLRAVSSGSPFEVECRFRQVSDGAYRWHLCRALPVLDEKNRIIKWFGTSTDIDDQKKAEEQVRHQALHDSLTGLPNRNLLEDRLNQAIISASRNKEKFSVVLLDLDNFKTINDNLGHPIGDELLLEVGRRLRRAVRNEDTVARLGGDEFTILAMNISNKLDAVRISRKIFDALGPAFSIDGHELHVTTSMGLAIYPLHGRDALTLLKNADIALYKAKDQGKNTAHFYNRLLDVKAKQRFSLEHSIRYALKHGAFSLHYQPIEDLNSGKTVAIEALLRWDNPGREMATTEEIIECAEDGGLIHHLTDFVLKTVCQEMNILIKSGFPDIKVAINLSPKQFMQPALVDTVISYLEDCEVNPHNLRFEITENLAMRNIDATLEKLNILKRRGVEVYLDDFGIGHSSLNHLKKFPIQSLKIDKSFIRDCTRSKQDAAIVRAIISMAQNLNLNVIAEGVENGTQFDFLKELGCDAAQGYFISKPLPASSLHYYLRKERQSQKKKPKKA